MIVSEYLKAIWALIFIPGVNNFEIFQVLVKVHNFSNFLEFNRYLCVNIAFYSTTSFR